MTIIEWLKPDSEVINTLLFVIVITVILLGFCYLILPNISSTSNFQEECNPDPVWGGCLP